MPFQSPAPMPTVTERMRAFVENYVQLGGRNATRAAVLAGYAESGAAAIASRLLRDPRVLAYLRHIAVTKIRAGVIESVHVLEGIRDDPTVTPGERRKAASELLDRAGLLIERISTLNVHHHTSPTGHESFGRMLLNLLGDGRDSTQFSRDSGVAIVDPIAFAAWCKRIDGTIRDMDRQHGGDGETIYDAPFEEVEELPPEPAPMVDGTEGLADLL